MSHRTQNTAETVEAAAALGAQPFATRWSRKAARFCRMYPLGAVGVAIILVLLVVAAIPGVFAPYHYADINIADRLVAPNGTYWLGTDDQGRDTLSRVIYGAQTSVIIGFGTVFLASLIATVLGIMSAYWGSWVDLVIQRFVDIWMAFPGLIFVVFAVSIFGNARTTIIVTIAVVFASGSSRVVRSAALSVLSTPFVEAARAMGAGGPRIVVRHVLPNVMAVVIVNASVQIGAVIIIESSLSFLGFGVPPPFPSWGRMLNDAQAFVYEQPWLAVIPGVAIVITVYAFNVFGDALRDAMDPRLRGAR